MNGKRSYLDTLNASRRRRPAASISDLDRTLAEMEGRDRPMDRWTSREAPAGGEHRRGLGGSRRAFQAVTKDLERSRAEQDGYQSVGRIAGELKALREDLRQQMSHGLQHEFDVLRKEIRQAAAAAPHARARDLGAEFERLSDAVQSLAERGDDRNINMLRLELEQVRNALDTLAREETVKSVDRRWDEFDRRWSALESRVGGQGDLELRALGDQVEHMAAMLRDLPDSVSLRALDDKVRLLADSMDRMARSQGSFSPEALALIEGRLDEISRAIAVSGAAAQPVSFDPEPFERIEARMNSLTHQIDELVQERPGAAIADHMGVLSGRIDDIARRLEMPEAMVERLAEQMELISGKLDHSPRPDMDLVFQNLESRFEHLSHMMERRQDDAMEQGHQLFRELERRLEQVADRLEPSDTGAEMMEAIDRRFAELAARLERNEPGNGPAAMKGLEARLDDISRRLELSTSQAPGIDPEIIRSLEAQVADLSSHLSRPGRPLPEFDEIAPRLAHIEQAIAGNREAILDAAREVAQDAARAVSAAPADLPVVAELAAELRSLDALTRKSDERNAKTFEAIHDTLLKIVDRLGALETSGVEGHASLRPQDTPSLDPTAPTLRSPAEAAAAAASHARQEEDHAAPATSPLSMLGGLTRKLAGRREPEAAKAEPTLEIEPRETGLDEPLDPKLANRPLEPGTGAPDLSAIMKRVRYERGQPAQQPGADAAKSDFIAAARRAAQAAAAEAEIQKQGADPAGSRTAKLGGLFKARRKTLLLAATGILVVLGGLQLGSALLSGNDGAPRVAASETAPAPVAAETSREAEVERAAASVETGPVRMVEGRTPEYEAAARAITASALSPEFADAGEDALFFAEELELADDIPAVERTDAELVASIPAPEPLPLAVQAQPALPGAGPSALVAAANEGDPKAMYEVGSRHAEGRGTAADMELSAKWFERAAEQGYAPAQYRIGNLYEKGIGVERNLAKSKEWYHRAAVQGNASAMHNLAVLHAMGADGTTDNDTAARWFMEAAELGVRDSQFNLGILAAKGAGMPQSLEESYKWFALVADAGDRDAAAKRDEVAGALRPEQLERARAAAALWKPRDADPEANVVELPEEWTEGAAQEAAVDMRQALRDIQSILNRNGYDAGTPDGMMGPRTKAAIAAFQKDQGLAADGEVNEELVNALLALR